MGIATIKIDHIHWYLPHYPPSIQQLGCFSKQILSKTPTGLRYNERSVSVKAVNNQSRWSFELGSQESMNFSIWKIIGIQQREIQDSQNLRNDRFCRLPVNSAQASLVQKNTLMLAFYRIMMMMFLVNVMDKLKKFFRFNKR